MRTLRDLWPIIRIAVVGLLLVSGIAGWVGRARALGRADAEADRAEILSEGIESLRAELDSASAERSRDSTALVAAREADEAREDSLRAASTALRASGALLADARRELRERAVVGGAVPTATFEDYVRMSESAIAVADSIAANAETRATIAEAGEERERTAAEALRVDMGEVERYAASLEERDVSRVREIAELRSAGSPSWIERAKQDAEMLAVALIFGALTWEVVR